MFQKFNSVLVGVLIGIILPCLLYYFFVMPTMHHYLFLGNLYSQLVMKMLPVFLSRCIFPNGASPLHAGITLRSIITEPTIFEKAIETVIGSHVFNGLTNIKNQFIIVNFRNTLKQYNSTVSIAFIL